MEDIIKKELKEEETATVTGGDTLKFIGGIGEGSDKLNSKTLGGINDTNTEVERSFIGSLPRIPVIPIIPETEPVENGGKNNLK